MVDVDKVRQISYDIHLYFGSGFLEKVYENSLVNRLKKAGFEVEQQSSLCGKKMQKSSKKIREGK